MSIHHEHPFAGPPDPVRRFRGRLGGAVTLWTSGAGTGRAGLTVSSVMVANGEPGRILGLLDPDGDLFASLSGTRRAVVTLLSWSDRDLADAFGGLAPAPGGPFRMRSWDQTPHGPALAGRTAAAVSLEDATPVGWSVLAICRIDRIDLVEEGTDEPVPDDAGPDEPAPDALEHRRGHYRRAPG